MSAKYTAYDCLASAAARSFLLATGHKDHAEAILNLRYYARELESDNREQRELLKDAKLNFARIAGVAENSQSAQLARLLKIKTLAEEAIAEFGSDGPDHNQPSKRNSWKTALLPMITTDNEMDQAIAAAPDLLAALNRLLRAFEADVEQVPSMDIVTSWETNSQAIQAARTAISKAEGRA